MPESDRLEEPGHAECRELAGEHRLGPRGGHEALRGEVVDLVGLGVAHHGGQRVLVEEVRGHDLDAVEQVVDPLVGVVGGAAHHADDVVALGQEELGEVGAVLPGDARDQRGAAGLPRSGGRIRFPPLFFPVLAAGVACCGTHFSDQPWLVCVNCVARDPSRETTSATRITRPSVAGIPNLQTVRVVVDGATAAHPRVHPLHQVEPGRQGRLKRKGDPGVPFAVHPPRRPITHPAIRSAPRRRRLRRDAPA